MIALWFILTLIAGLIVGGWAVHWWQKQARWEQEWRRACHPSQAPPDFELEWLDLDAYLGGED